MLQDKNLIQIETELASYEGKDKVVSSHDLKKHLLSFPKNAVKLRTGFSEMDRYLNCFEGGELTVISGETGHGKTLFGQTLTHAFAEAGSHSLWFTYEVPALQFINQFGQDPPLFYLPTVLEESSLTWIEKRIWESKLKFNTEAVFIDHLHFLIDMKSKHNMSLEIGFVMRSLKKMALKFNIAIFLLAHTEKIKNDGEPDVRSLRDSSFVGQESDNVLFIWRKKDSDNEAILKIAKNRKNGVMNKKIGFIKIGQFLKEMAHGDTTNAVGNAAGYTGQDSRFKD